MGQNYKLGLAIGAFLFVLFLIIVWTWSKNVAVSSVSAVTYDSTGAVTVTGTIPTTVDTTGWGGLRVKLLITSLSSTPFYSTISSFKVTTGASTNSVTITTAASAYTGSATYAVNTADYVHVNPSSIIPFSPFTKEAASTATASS